MMPVSQPKLEDFLGGGNGGVQETATYYSHQQGQEEEASRDYHQYQHHQLIPYIFHPMTEAEMLQEDAAPMDDAMAKNFLMTSYGACYSNGEMHPLSLSMTSPGSQSSSCVSAAPQQQHHQMAAVAAAASAAAAQGRSNGGGGEQCVGRKRGTGKGGQKQPVHRKSIDTFGQRTSRYRGVTRFYLCLIHWSRHRWTGRYEAHLWDNSCRKDGQTRKGRQGGYDTEDKAARAYDLAALKYWGPATHINFPVENYQDELEEMKSMTRQEFVAHLRRSVLAILPILWYPSVFSSLASCITEAGMSQEKQWVFSRCLHLPRSDKFALIAKYVLTPFAECAATQEEAAEAYDIAAIKFRGLNAVTNFDITRYDVDKITESSTLLPVEEARKVKAIEAAKDVSTTHNNGGRELNPKEETSSDWRMVLHGSSQEAVHCPEAIDLQKSVMSGSHSMHGIVGLDVECVAHDHHLDVVPGSVNFSNSSSLVTSLSNSREGSPERLGLAMLYGKQQHAVSLAAMSTWMPVPAPTGQHVVSHLPVFAAWADA
ncbi:hypothetical protein HU200_048588 [Digitaria exilis]|uniref:AP2/ERF domain-containing protein n=1 Tax=Digitaria exilis TaxID=1010633 RepID=A0A835B1K4_9POAL|nr:hypothetical protein HU200_048588 [Digitaria exilis]